MRVTERDAQDLGLNPDVEPSLVTYRTWHGREVEFTCSGRCRRS